MNLWDTVIGALLGTASAETYGPPVIMATESIMSQKAHVQSVAAFFAERITGPQRRQYKTIFAGHAI
eukprot:2671043-Ditylum_brightwellii.AAC.1